MQPHGDGEGLLAAIQRLFALSMSLQGAYKITEKPAVAARLAQGITDLDDTVKVIRSSIFSLNSHELGEQVPTSRVPVDPEPVGTGPVG